MYNTLFLFIVETAILKLQSYLRVLIVSGFANWNEFWFDAGCRPFFLLLWRNIALLANALNALWISFNFILFYFLLGVSTWLNYKWVIIYVDIFVWSDVNYLLASGLFVATGGQLPFFYKLVELAVIELV